MNPCPLYKYIAGEIPGAFLLTNSPHTLQKIISYLNIIYCKYLPYIYECMCTSCCIQTTHIVYMHTHSQKNVPGPPHVSLPWVSSAPFDPSGTTSFLAHKGWLSALASVLGPLTKARDNNWGCWCQSHEERHFRPPRNCALWARKPQSWELLPL